MALRLILWNLLGLGFPLVVAAVTVPKLLILIGSERFGFLALAWSLIGYAGALDLGIGRAVTQRVSALQGANESADIPLILSTAVRLTLLTSLAGVTLFVLAAYSGLYKLINVAAIPDQEIELSLLLLSTAIPVQAISATYRGVNEAYLNFKGISLIRMVLGGVNFLGPFCIAWYSSALPWLIASLVLSRALALGFYRRSAYRCLQRSGIRESGQYSRQVAKQLLGFGSWFTATSIVGPLMVQSDRFFVGALISAAAITAYVIPYEVVTQALVGVGAITSVAFPVIGRLLVADPNAAKRLFHTWLFRTVILMATALSALAYILPDLLTIWLKQAANPESVLAGRILIIGVMFNAVGCMYFALLHAKGHSKPTALLHLMEMPLYFLLLFTFIQQYGVAGCAIAWSVRNIIDSLALIALSHKLVLRN